MRYRIKTHQDFDKEFKRLCKKYSSLKADLSALGKSLSENPDQGTSLGKGVRKVRMAIASKGKGKSHGARVITYTEAIVCADNEGTVILLTIYGVMLGIKWLRFWHVICLRRGTKSDDNKQSLF